MDISELVASAVAGDVDAFTTLVQRYQSMAFGYAFSILGDFHLAEDATQEAFIAAYRNLPNLQNRERFGGWMRGIVRYECLHLLRSRRGRHPDRPAAWHSRPNYRSGRGIRTGSLDGAWRSQSTSGIRAYCQCPVLHPGSLATRCCRFLNLSVNTVNNRLRTARKHLREGESSP